MKGYALITAGVMCILAAAAGCSPEGARPVELRRERSKREKEEDFGQIEVTFSSTGDHFPALCARSYILYLFNLSFYLPGQHV